MASTISLFASQSAGWIGANPLEVLITRACEPSLPEPNYALNLEVADYINQKKANTPRDAAMYVVRLVNHRNPHVGMLAITLLDTLVQSCGYPLHLQVATKEFLNELVRRFPERPPPFPGPVMQRILDLINNWKEGICQDSRWRQDLGNIRDMHRLLSFKGYRFRDVGRQAAALAAGANLKSAEELEEEDRAAQSAKLQELIRRGTPRDLAAAQEIMKALAGADPDAKPDYRAQALTELNKLEAKVILLNEMLDNVHAEGGERFVAGDAYDQVSSILSSARPKIQKWISDAETEDPESLDTFLQINDQINTVLNRYDAFKRGDYVAAANPIPDELAATSKTANNLSLIDLDDVAPPAGSTSGTTVDELADLFGPAAVATSAPPLAAGIGFGNAGASVPLGMGARSGSAGYPSPLTGARNNGGYNSPQPQYAHSSAPSTPGAQLGSIMLPATPQGQRPGAGGTGNVGRAGMGIGASAPAPTTGYFAGLGGVGQPPMQQQQQPQQHQQTATTASQIQGKDPFADLAGLF